jgi:hypothetical protein
MIEKQETNNCETNWFARIVQLSTIGHKLGDFVSLLHIRAWWDYACGFKHQLESYIVFSIKLRKLLFLG